MPFKFIRKNVFFVSLALVVLIVTIFNDTYKGRETKIVTDLPVGHIGEEIQKTEFIQGDKYTTQTYKSIHPQGQLIHNNGRPIKNDVITNGGDQKLFGVFQIIINDADHEYYVFSPLDKMDMEELRKEVLEQKNFTLEQISSSNEDIK
ncbi:MAG: hypothetical protein ACQEWV_27020 [Bacillota bacterium]